MLLRQTHRTRGRRGSAIVEASLSLTVFCLLLFGVFEYCRYLFVLHTADLAAREGVRYASVNSDKPTTFDYTDFTDAGGTSYQSIVNYTGSKMGQSSGSQTTTATGIFSGYSGIQYTVTVFPVDPAGLLLTPAVVQAKTQQSGWNNASFPDRIAVRITGTFKPFLPNLSLIPTLPINVTALSGVEG